MPPVRRATRPRWLLALALGAAAFSPEVRAQAPADPDRLVADATFDFVWTRIRDTYYDPTFRGLDWEAVRDELRPRALAARTEAELRAVLTDLVERLGESHFTIIPGTAADAFEPGDDLLPGDADVGIDLRWIEGELVVTRVRAEGPSERAGVRTGWSVESVAGLASDSIAERVRSAAASGDEERQVALWAPANALRRLRGPRGSSVDVSFRSAPGASPVTLRLERERAPGQDVVFGNLPPIRVETESHERPLPNGGRVVVARWSAWFPTVVPWIAGVVDGARDAEGIVVDLRGNPGGLGALVMGIGGHFFDEPISLGAMRTRETELRFVVNPQRVTPDGRRVEPYSGPVAILVDALSASTSEFFAEGLQATGRARVFGEPTAGQALPAVVVELPNGDLMMHVLADFTGPDGSRLEGSGVRPDVFAPPSRGALLAGEDPALEAAFQWIQSTQESPR